MDDIVYYDVEILLAPSVVMRGTEGTKVVDAAQATAIKTWLAKDLAGLEKNSKVIVGMAASPALGDAASDGLLKDVSAWLSGTYVPSMRRAVAAVAAGETLAKVHADLGAPWAGPAGEQAKSRIAALRALLAKKAR
jgi:hypothetical protein